MDTICLISLCVLLIFLGKVGDWKVKMTVEDSEFFDIVYRHKKMDTEGPSLRFQLP